MKVYEFEVSYHAWVCVCIGGYIDDFKKVLHERYSGKMPRLWTINNEGKQVRQPVKEIRATDGYSVWVDYEPEKGRDEIFYMWVETIEKHLIHEISHVTRYIMFVRGYDYTSSEENWAYMNQEIFDNLISAILENKSKKNDH